MNLLFSVFGVMLLSVLVIGRDSRRSHSHDGLSEMLLNQPGNDSSMLLDLEMLLGQYDTHQIEALTNAERREKRSTTFKEIDRDQDGKVGLPEIRDWLEGHGLQFMQQRTEKKWGDFQLGEGKLSFEQYKVRMEADGDSAEAVARSQRRWAVADRDGDKMLTKEEFQGLLHPEESEHMREVLVQESMEQLDKNNNRVVELEEFISDLWVPDKDEAEPAWLEAERKEFRERMDSNKDGVVDKEELVHWNHPRHSPSISTEARLILEHADTNKDGYLTEEEILRNGEWSLDSEHPMINDEFEEHIEL